jgi:cytochrome c oxidase subunit IV
MSDIPLSKDQLREEDKKYHTFYNLAIILSFVTMIEVVAIFLPFVTGVIFWSLVVLSLVKFFAVIFIFMHLVYDKKIYTLLFLAGLILATGTVVALSLLFSADRVDHDAIGWVDPGLENQLAWLPAPTQTQTV